MRLLRDAAGGSGAAPRAKDAAVLAEAAPAQLSRATPPLAAARAAGRWARRALDAAARTLFRYTPIIAVLAIWEIAPHVGLANPDVLPPFDAVARAWWRLVRSGDLPQDTIVSLINLCCGLGLGVVVGIVLGIGTARSPAFEALTNPLVKSLYPTPKSALIPVMILWFGMGSKSIIASIFMGALLPVAMSAYNGTRGIERSLVWSALTLGARRGQVLWEIILPAAFPEILAGVRTALGISFIIMVAAEFLFGQRGLGYLISLLGDGGVYPGMFAAILTVSVIGFLADRLYLMLMKRALQWRG